MRLLTAPTPNGWKVSILIEELREQGHPMSNLVVEYVDIRKGEQFEPAFVRVNPNQKIPALEDDGFTLMESCAILQYLGEKFPSPLLPQEFEPRFEVLQWVYWQAANVGPVFGNKLSYTRYMDDIDPAAKAHPMERFAAEAQRLLGVLSRQLEGRDFLCGAEFSIADIALYPWVRGWKWSKIPIVGIPHIEDWVQACSSASRCGTRPRLRSAQGRNRPMELQPARPKWPPAAAPWRRPPISTAAAGETLNPD